MLTGYRVNLTNGQVVDLPVGTTFKKAQAELARYRTIGPANVFLERQDLDTGDWVVIDEVTGRGVRLADCPRV